MSEHITCTKPVPGFTLGKTYPAKLKTHRVLAKDGSLVRPTVARCVETENDNGDLILFTERPSVRWHRPYMDFRAGFTVEPSRDDEISPAEFARIHELFCDETGISLLPAQQIAARAVLNLDHALVHGQTGTGKTIVGIFLTWYAVRVKSRKVVVVSPRALTQQWTDALDLAGLNVQPNVEVWAQSRVSSQYFTITEKDTEVILDEAHWLCHLPKDPVLFLQATSNAVRKTALTATPERLVNSDYFAIYGWLMVPGWHKGVTTQEFPYAIWERPSYEKIGEPPIGRAIQMRLPDMGNLPPLTLTLLEGQPVDLRHRSIVRMIQSRQKPTMVFAPHIQDLRAVSRHLLHFGIPHQFVHGHCEDPQHLVTSFNRGACNVLLMTTGMGVGLSVDRAEDIYFMTPPMGAVQLNQSLGRAYRVTSKRPVEAFFFENDRTYLDSLLEFVNRTRIDMGLAPLSFQVASRNESSSLTCST